MKNILVSKKAKGVVDIAIVVCAIVMLAYSDPHVAAAMGWRSSHCIIGSVILGLIIIHVAQHWKFVKAFTKKKVIQKNRLTALMVVVFVVMLLSMVFFAFSFGHSFLKFHNVLGHIFMVVAVIHFIDRFKRLLMLFK